MVDLGHGFRLGDREYERLVVELHEGLPPMPTKAQNREIRRAELELAIDHRLGRGFPRPRRERLWAIKERVAKRRLRLAGRFIVDRLFSRKQPTGGQVREAEGLAAYLVDEFAKELNEEELRSFFDLEPGAKPTLPVDFGGQR